MGVESPGAFNSASTYPAEQSRRAWFGWAARDGSGDIGSGAGGLRAATDLTLTAPVSGLSVNVGVGECWVPGTSSTLQGLYYGRVSSTTNLVIAAANATNPRVDLVCATITDSAYSGASNTFIVQVVTGTPSSGATLTNLTGAPALPTSSLLLGYVLTPASATNTITADISNLATVINTAPGIGPAAWTSYTPTWSTSGTAPAIGNGTLLGKYVQLGKLVAVRIYLLSGSTTTFGTGGWGFTLPFATRNDATYQSISGVCTPSGTTYGITALIAPNATAIAPVLPASGAAVNATTPNTWTTGNALTMQGVYESA